MGVFWNRATQRFHDTVTNKFVSRSKSVPQLTMSGSALRDSRGRYVPRDLLGGNVVRQWPTGRGEYSAVTRKVRGSVEQHRVRPQDMLSATVEYSYQGGEKQTTQMTMRKGTEYVEELATERIAQRIAGVEEGTGVDIDFEGDVELMGIDWDITTWYGRGESIGSDYSWYQGYQSG